MSEILNSLCPVCRAPIEPGSPVRDASWRRPWSRQRIPVLAAIATARGENASALRKTVTRMRQRFRHHMKTQLAPTLAESTDMEDEMRALFAVLSGP